MSILNEAAHNVLAKRSRERLLLLVAMIAGVLVGVSTLLDTLSLERSVARIGQTGGSTLILATGSEEAAIDTRSCADLGTMSGVDHASAVVQSDLVRLLQYPGRTFPYFELATYDELGLDLNSEVHVGSSISGDFEVHEIIEATGRPSPFVVGGRLQAPLGAADLDNALVRFVSPDAVNSPYAIACILVLEPVGSDAMAITARSAIDSKALDVSYRWASAGQRPSETIAEFKRRPSRFLGAVAGSLLGMAIIVASKGRSRELGTYRSTGLSPAAMMLLLGSELLFTTGAFITGAVVFSASAQLAFEAPMLPLSLYCVYGVIAATAIGMVGSIRLCTRDMFSLLKDR